MAEFTITSGNCYALFAYDAARSMNLDVAERRIREATQRQTAKHKRRAPRYFEYQPPPLRLTQEGRSIALGGFRTYESVEVILYDFGAVSVIYSIPIQGPLSTLLDLSDELYDNEELFRDSLLRVKQIAKAIGDAATAEHVNEMVEDYVVYRIDAVDQPFEPDKFCSAHAQELAGILRAERRALSDQEVKDGLAAQASYGKEDLAIVDWNAALLIDPEGDDIQAVLEFANVELLEMRYLDQKLDWALNEAYETLSRRAWSFPRLLGYYGTDLRRVAELQVDNAALFEGVNNTVKLLGDQYLARVYRLISQRFHLDEWDASIIRKLQTIESIYEKISDQAGNRRMEFLEWVIIILIAFSILLEFV